MNHQTLNPKPSNLKTLKPHNPKTLNSKPYRNLDSQPHPRTPHLENKTLQVVPGSSKTMNFIQFVESLRHVANTCRLSINEVMERLVVVWGPERQGPESASANTPDVLLTETFARSSRGFNTDVDGQPDGRLMFGNAMSQMASGHQTFSVVADSAQSSGALVPAWPFTA